MFLAVGSGAYVAAMFHMVTHAFFKALLFLGSGVRHPRHARRAGHAPHGRAAQGDAGHGGDVHRRLAGHRRRAAVRRLLEQGRHPARRLRQEPGAVGNRSRHRTADRVLHDPPGDHGLLRQGAMARRARGARAPRRRRSRTRARRSCCSRSSCWPGCRSSAAGSTCRSKRTPRSSTHWLEPVVGVHESDTAKLPPCTGDRDRRALVIGIAAVVHGLRQAQGEADRAAGARRRLVLRRGGQQLHGWSRAQGVRRHRRGSTPTSSTAPSTASADWCAARHSASAPCRAATCATTRPRSASASCCCSAGSSSVRGNR